MSIKCHSNSWYKGTKVDGIEFLNVIWVIFQVWLQNHQGVASNRNWHLKLFEIINGT